jgi:F-type H+-transporting ATPase subunit alpha
VTVKQVNQLFNRYYLKSKEFYDAGNQFSVYVAIGQKASTVAGIAKMLEEKEQWHTIIVAANASDPAPMQVYAPFAGAAIGEYFRDSGRPALIVYDDLSKQAVATVKFLFIKKTTGT